MYTKYHESLFDVSVGDVTSGHLADAARKQLVDEEEEEEMGNRSHSIVREQFPANLNYGSVSEEVSRKVAITADSVDEEAENAEEDEVREYCGC
jgi:ATP-dependent protease Clp ATPase subunit